VLRGTRSAVAGILMALPRCLLFTEDLARSKPG
jgi:hypothetical protein